MSKKAKKHKKSKRATALDHMRCERDLANGLVEKYANEITALMAEVQQSREQANKNDERAKRQFVTIESQRDSISKLKGHIADLEKAVAYADGRNSELERQIDQAADKVMVRPPVMVSPAEARRFNQTNRVEASGNMDAFRSAFERGGERTVSMAMPKRWTDL